MPKIREKTLSNGQTVAYRSRADFDILVRELLDSDGMYLQHGIHLRDGDCIFDVGSNIGFFLLQLNRILSQGRVFCFEPIPDVFEVLQQNAAHHNHLEVTLHQVGLSRYDGSAEFTYFPRTSVASTMRPNSSAAYRRQSRLFVLAEMRNRGGLPALAASIIPSWCLYPVTELVRRYFQQSTQVSCRVCRLSTFLDEHPVDRIDLLKIDTEGAEEDVLAGIEPRHWPLVRQAVVEVHDGREGRARVERFLEDRGFSVAGRQLMTDVEHLHVIYARRRPGGTSDIRSVGSPS